MENFGSTICQIYQYFPSPQFALYSIQRSDAVNASTLFDILESELYSAVFDLESWSCGLPFS